MIGQTVAIYRSRRTGEYRIQPCARAGGVPQEFGPQIILPSDVSAEELLQVVIDNLSKTDSQKYVLSLAPNYPPEEHRRMLKEDRLINVRRLDDEFKLVPFQRMRNSFGSIDNMTKTVRAADFIKTGGEMIRDMFDEMP